MKKNLLNKWTSSPGALVTQWLEHATVVPEVLDSIPTWNFDFFQLFLHPLPSSHHYVYMRCFPFVYSNTIGAIGDSVFVKERVLHIQTVGVATLTALTSFANISNHQSSSKRNLSIFIAKKLLQPSNEKCLDVLHGLLKNRSSSLLVVRLLSKLCTVSRELSIYLLRNSSWRESLKMFFKNLSGLDDQEGTICALEILCATLLDSDEIPEE